MRFAIAALMSLLLVGTIFAQDSESPQDTTQASAPEGTRFSIGGGIALGADVLLTGAPDPLSANPTAPTAQTWTRLSFQPELAYGKIGVGFDLTFHFMLYPDNSTAFKLYDGDWVPADGRNVFDVYLPKILYVRYGIKGEDPLFAKLGSINDLSLGNGFIMSDYSNMRFLPERRLFGLDLGLDGSLFNFPMVGIEALTGNLARFDVIGTRVYVRPLIGTEIPLLKNMQVGATVVADTNPYLYFTDAQNADPLNDIYANTADPIAAYGADVIVPILGGKLFPLAAFTDVAINPNKSAGWMVGFGGRLIGLFTYGAQLRVLQDGFIPAYFDANYDLNRVQKYNVDKGSSTYTGWYSTLGTSLFSDVFVFNVAMDGPFKAIPAVATAKATDYPHLRGVLKLNEINQFPFFFDASYDKSMIGSKTGFFEDLVDPSDAVIGLNVNYKTGASVLTLAYSAKWDPNSREFNVTSSLQASMKF